MGPRRRLCVSGQAGSGQLCELVLAGPLPSSAAAEARRRRELQGRAFRRTQPPACLACSAGAAGPSAPLGCEPRRCGAPLPPACPEARAGSQRLRAVAAGGGGGGAEAEAAEAVEAGELVCCSAGVQSSCRRLLQAPLPGSAAAGTDTRGAARTCGSCIVVLDAGRHGAGCRLVRQRGESSTNGTRLVERRRPPRRCAPPPRGGAHERLKLTRRLRTAHSSLLQH